MKIIRKIKIVLIPIVMLAASSCLGIICINGNGVAGSESRPESGFHGIENTTSADVHFTVADSYSVVVEADENILPYIRTSVSAGYLVIDISGTRCIRTDISPVVKVSGPALTGISSAGSGHMFADTLFGTTINIQDTGSGDIIVNHVEAGDIDILNTGSGDISAGSLVAQDARFRISGSGNIDIDGEAVVTEITSTGSGNLGGDDLVSQVCNTLITGSGNVFVTVESELIATLTGSGNLFYRGYPTIYSNITGSGRIISTNK